MLTKASFALCLLLGAVAAKAEPETPSTGRFPSGKVYHTEELSSLVGRGIPQPSYLVGNFIYLGLMGGTPTFSTFNADAGKVRFGNTILHVQFAGGFPSAIDVGKAIEPNEGDPLTIIRVESPKGGPLVIVTAESSSF